MVQNSSPGESRGGTYFLGRYRVVDEIGIGGMASVHLARMDGPGGFQKWVAIKRIHAHLVEDETFIQMFLDEARVAARISHPNVAQVFELGKHDDTYWIAMEYLHGEPLREVMRRTEEIGQPMPPEIACRIIADAAEGLNAAHELLGKAGEKLNLVHRDVTPHNLFVTYDGTTKVVDFGIAKFSSRMANTRAGTLKGKLAYMSPEQVNGEQIDRRTDIFALGVVLWELTTGQRLFRMESDLDTLAKVQECNVPRPSTIIRGYPLDLEKIILKTLAKNKGERFKTAREMSRALQSLLMKRGLFIASDEVSAYTQAIFADRMQRRDAHLRWAAEVTQTISLDKADGMQELSTGSFESYQSGQPGQPPVARPAAGAPVRATLPQAPRPNAGPAVVARPAAGMPAAAPKPQPSSLVDSGETRAAAHPPVQPPRPAGVHPAPQARVQVEDEIIEEDGPTIARASPAHDDPPTMLGPGAAVPMGGAVPMPGASVDDLQDFDEDRTIVTGAPTEEEAPPAGARPAAGNRPTVPPAPRQQLGQAPTAPAAFQPARPGAPGGSPFQPAAMAPQQNAPYPGQQQQQQYPGQQQQYQGQQQQYPGQQQQQQQPQQYQGQQQQQQYPGQQQQQQYPGQQQQTYPQQNAPHGGPADYSGQVPAQATPYGSPGASGGFPAPAIPPMRRDQPTVTLQAVRKGPPMWLVGVASGVVVLLLLSVGYFAFTRMRQPPQPQQTTAAGAGPFASARAGFASAIVPSPTPTTGATDVTPPPTTTDTASAAPTASAPPTVTATATATATQTAVATTPTPTPTPTMTAVKPTPTPTMTAVKPTPTPTPLGTGGKLPTGTPTGQLTVICFPSCDQVYDNGVPLGYPVVKKTVPVGMHKLKLVNGSVNKTISTGVEADKETKERVSVQ
jgi:serine/threonine-protein kinase